MLLLTINKETQMAKPQEFILKLERKTLDSCFELVEQELPIDVVIPASYFQKIAYQVNKVLKDKELFIVKAFCKVETFLLIRQNRQTSQKFKIVIEHLVNYNGIVVESTQITIE